MPAILGALIRCAIWYVVLFWTMTYFLGISRTAAVVSVPFIIVTGVSLRTWRSYRGIHRRRGRTHQAPLRGPVRQAGAAGSRYRAGPCRGPGTCSRCPGSGLSQVPRGLWQEDIPDIRDDLPSLPGGIRLRYAPAPPLDAGGMDAANLNPAVQYMRNRYAPPAGRGKSNVVVSGSGYTRGGQASAHVRSVTVNQPHIPHPVTCRCVACMPVQPSGAVTGCVCPSCTPPGLVSAQANCSCPSCAAFRQQLQQGGPLPALNVPHPPPYAPGGIVPSPPAASAGQPLTFRSRPKPAARPGTRGMGGFDGADLVAGTALGYRWWSLKAPLLHLSPSGAAEDWKPGLLRGAKDFWKPGINLAQCLQHQHSFEEIPHDACADGFWAYWEIQQHDLGAAGSLPVIGVVRASGQVIVGPRGFRAQKAEIIALHLPFRIQPDLPATRPLARRPSSPPRPQARFTGRVISFPGAPPVPPSLGGPAPAPPPPEPEPPTGEEIQAAKDAAEAWEAVIADRLATTYPGAEVCAELSLMKAKYPVTSEYSPPPPPEPPVMTVSCPYCGVPCDAKDIHMHVVSNHYF